MWSPCAQCAKRASSSSSSTTASQLYSSRSASLRQLILPSIIYVIVHRPITDSDCLCVRLCMTATMRGTTIFYYFRRLRCSVANAASLRHDINVRHCLNSRFCRHSRLASMFAQCDDPQQTMASLEKATTNQIQSCAFYLLVADVRCYVATHYALWPNVLLPF